MSESGQSDTLTEPTTKLKQDMLDLTAEINLLNEKV